MGFYAPSQLIQDAKRHGVEIRPADIVNSRWDCTLEQGADSLPALRLGLRLVKGFSAAGCARVLRARNDKRFRDVQDLATRAELDRADLGAIAAAGALRPLTGNRHRARWDVAGVEAPLPLMPQIEICEGVPMLRKPTEGEDVIADYQSMRLTLGRHPMALLREKLSSQNICTAAGLWELPDGTTVSTAGLVITRQRPGTAKGVTFVTLEDETGHVNLIVWEHLADRQRKVLLGSQLLGVQGQLQKQADVLHVVARSLRDHSYMLGSLVARSRDFH